MEVLGVWSLQLGMGSSDVVTRKYMMKGPVHIAMIGNPRNTCLASACLKRRPWCTWCSSPGQRFNGIYILDLHPKLNLVISWLSANQLQPDLWNLVRRLRWSTLPTWSLAANCRFTNNLWASQTWAVLQTTLKTAIGCDYRYKKTIVNK